MFEAFKAEFNGSWTGFGLMFSQLLKKLNYSDQRSSLQLWKKIATEVIVLDEVSQNSRKVGVLTEEAKKATKSEVTLQK